MVVFMAVFIGGWMALTAYLAYRRFNNEYKDIL